MPSICCWLLPSVSVWGLGPVVLVYFALYSHACWPLCVCWHPSLGFPPGPSMLNLACSPSSMHTWLNLLVQSDPLALVSRLPTCMSVSSAVTALLLTTNEYPAIPLEALPYQSQLKPWVTHCPWHSSSASASSSKRSLLSLSGSQVHGEINSPTSPLIQTWTLHLLNFSKHLSSSVQVFFYLLSSGLINVFVAS